MRFVPVTPARLVVELAGWINDLPTEHPLVGFDGPAEIGTAELADSVARRVETLGRPVIRVSTQWWWRPASLRLEFGRTDLDMLLAGWVDGAAIQRELFDPLKPGGSGRYLLRLRDPATDRSLREQRVAAAARSVVLMDGPFLQAGGLGLDAVVYLQVSAGTMARSLPADRQWWLQAFRRYLDEDRPADGAAAVIAYDHPGHPRSAGRKGRGQPSGDDPSVTLVTISTCANPGACNCKQHA